MKTVYLAHCYGGDPMNRANAKKWARWALERGVAVLADWLWITEVWTEEKRMEGMRVNRELINRADEVWLVGPEISQGMKDEANHARERGKPVVDFTKLALP